jgi:hypothetical protein
MRRAYGRILALCAVSVPTIPAGCGGGSPFAPGADAAPGPDAAPTPDAAPPDAGSAWTTLLSAEWSLPPHSENYLCVRKTIDRDLTIGGFDPIAPLGTHHSVLGVDASGAPDGVTSCDGLVLAPQMLFGSGVGTQRLELPAGVGVKLAKGQHVLLNLHLFNAGDTVLTGTSGVQVEELAGGPLVVQAGAMLVGPIAFTIPTGTGYVDSGCTLGRAATLFAVAPHMHKLGVHMTAHLGATTLLDRDYSFDQQTFAVVSAPAQPGDRITTECTYANDTGAPVGFGQSTTQEMCFLIVYLYPAGGLFGLCGG